LASIATLVLYGSFLFVQNIRHKTYFLSPEETADLAGERPSKAMAIASLVLLVVCLRAVVLSVELLAPGLEHWIKSIGAPVSLPGVIIAFIVLLPEGNAAVQAARNNQLQKKFNRSVGSALAGIGLTLPMVAMVSLYAGLPLTMGIDIK
jgi:Ca2+:H+ antiporter